jgi:hypothetical protein
MRASRGGTGASICEPRVRLVKRKKNKKNRSLLEEAEFSRSGGRGRQGRGWRWPLQGKTRDREELVQKLHGKGRREMIDRGKGVDAADGPTNLSSPSLSQWTTNSTVKQPRAPWNRCRMRVESSSPPISTSTHSAAFLFPLPAAP